MTGSEVAQIITSIATLVASVGAFWISASNGKKVNAVAENVQVIEKATNSMKDALVAATAKASLGEGTAAGIVEGHAQGLEQGRKEERK